ncbi:MAG: Sec-independent protein translocase TatC [Marmoricola sp.]|nr:Sec-independent protein translocase TatC [Marmoricola sp.]
MALSRVVGAFSTKPRSKVGEGGRMALYDHFLELRGRLFQSALIFLVFVVIAFFFYNRLFDLLLTPYNHARELLGHGRVSQPVISGVGGPFLLQIKLCAAAAVVASSPFWLYQIWAFILPGLHPRERRWTRIFAAVAGPLFLAGVGTGYWILPKGLHVLLGLTPKSVESLVEFNDYFSFVVRLLLLFGVAFEIPLFVVMLNLAGVISGRTLGQHRPWIIIGVFAFAAVATPSTDPFTMCMLAIPMTVLFMISEIVARLVDRRRAASSSEWSDDEVSPIDAQ